MGKQYQRNCSVARGKTTPLNRDTQPIILVPGVMGSRLQKKDEPDNPIWDPDDTWSMVKLADKVTAYRMELFSVDDTAGEPFKKPHKSVDLLPHQIDRGWGGCAWGFYGRGLNWLEEASREVGGIVYCFGYDWRASNKDSGRRLKQVIKQVKDKHKKKPIVVTHSMGGLVTRAACKLGAEADVLGVVHTMQPANGTPLAYRQFMTGGASLHWVVEDIVLGRITGRSRTQYAAIASGTLGPMELLPSNDHRKTTGVEATDPPGRHTGRKPWLSWEQTGKIKHKLAKPEETDVYTIYKETTGRLGLIEYESFKDDKHILIGEGYIIPHIVDGAKIHDRILAGVDSAKAFHHTFLAGYVHPNTSVVAGNGLQTELAVHLDFDWNLVKHGTSANVVRDDIGDGTVALSSSTCLPLKGEPSLDLKDADRQALIDGVKHATAFGVSDAFNQLVWDMCVQVIQCA